MVKCWLLVPLLLFPLLLGASYPSAKKAEPSIHKARASGMVTLVEFGSDLCFDCQRLKPVLKELAREYRGRAHVIIVTVQDKRDIRDRYRIRYLPTLIFYGATGEELLHHTGFLGKDEIVKKLAEFGVPAGAEKP